MDPGALITDICHLKKIFVETCFPYGGPEERLMGSRRTGCHNNPVDLVFIDDLLHLVLRVLGTGKEVFIGEDHIGKCLRVGLHLGHIDNAADVDAAVADKDTDPRFFLVNIFLFREFKNNEVFARVHRL